MQHLGCQRELGIIGEFEVVAAGVTADDPALLQGDDDLWVEVPVALGEGAWSAGDDVEDFGRRNVAKPCHRALHDTLKVERDCENRRPAETPIKIIKTGVCRKGPIPGPVGPGDPPPLAGIGQKPNSTRSAPADPVPERRPRFSV